MNLRAPRDGEMYWDLSTYFPDAHYRKAMHQYGDKELAPDGGSRTQYYWSGEDGVVYHTEQGDDMVHPFFDTVEDAERFLERQADQHGKDRYSGMVLRKTGNRKVEEATDVLTEQSGIADFAPDGGYPVDEPEPPAQDREMQIENPAPDAVYFWYDPAADYIVQEEVDPYDVRGVFESRDDAAQFLEWYADSYGDDAASHLELYSADLAYEGQGSDHRSQDAAADSPDLPPQADFDEYLDD